jgi:TIR domain
MADIFISYSKKHAQLTEDLARDLEAEGYTTWWDTSLLPGDMFFPQTIRTEIEAAKPVSG